MNLRILILGDSESGKSSILMKYTSNEFCNDYMPTIGIDFRLKKINLGENSINLSIWDSSGQERFRKITTKYYNSDGIILVYDASFYSSIANIHKWLEDIYNYSERDINVVLVCNKIDLVEPGNENIEKGIELANKMKIQFYTMSAKTGENIEEVFNYIVKKAYEKKI
jgi:small GTP-binding protein